MYIADEGRRQAYLSALDIPLWVARAPLSGAYASETLAYEPYWQETYSTEDEPNLVQDGAIIVPAAPVAARASVEIPKLTVEKKPSQVPSVAPKQASETTSSFPRFACRIQRLNAQWLLVVEQGAGPDFSAQEYALWRNINTALAGIDGSAARVEKFFWPISPNPALPRDEVAACEALQVFLQERGQGAHILVLGQRLGRLVQKALPQQSVLVAATLSEMLTNAQFKRRFWQSIYG
jgi:hypothetical protein